VSIIIIIIMSLWRDPDNVSDDVESSCPLTKLNGGLSRLHFVDEDAVSWLTSYDTHTRRKKIIIINYYY